MGFVPENRKYSKEGEQEARPERRPESVPSPWGGGNHWAVVSRGATSSLLLRRVTDCAVDNGVGKRCTTESLLWSLQLRKGQDEVKELWKEGMGRGEGGAGGMGEGGERHHLWLQVEGKGQEIGGLLVLSEVTFELGPGGEER